jgi:Putative ABC exporter
VILGHPALRLLARMKLKAVLRQQRRRLRRPSGWIFGILGLFLMGSWALSLLVGRPLGPPQHLDRGLQVVAVQLAIAVVSLMALFGALSHRGLYLPKEEIELLFAAPVSRSDLVRYRLITNLFRSLFAGVVFGLLSLGRLPSRTFGMTGIVVTMLTLPLVGQAASLIAGDAENRLARLVSGRWTRLLQALSGILLWLLVMGLIFNDRLARHAQPAPGRFDPWAAAEHLLSTPWLHALLLPLKPWALMITARSGVTFATWLAVCVVVWLVTFELIARIPIDYRELSLETSADVARRLNRLRRGGFGASVGKASRRAAGWRVPWLLGRGPFGAIAWLKLGAILRKARGTVLISTLIVGALTFVFTLSFRGRRPEDAIGGAVMIAVLGTFYLCAGLKFDFRSDLEQMESIKAWPVRSWRVFLATILPEVLLVSGVLAAAILVRAAVTRAFHPALLGIALALPPVILAWVALDNAVFLFAPVRFVPGQEGALHHMGRSLALMFLRMVLLAISTGLAALPAVAAWFLAHKVLDLSESAAWWIAGGVAWCVLLAIDGALVVAGGVLFRRFDVSREPG